MWTKRQLVQEAYNELGAGNEASVPESMVLALRRLDSMVGTWEVDGLTLGYQFPSVTNQSDPDDDSGIGDGEAEAVFLNLAVRLAPGIGKAIPPDTKVNAAASYARLAARSVAPQPLAIPGGIPLGAGNRSVYGFNRQRFTPEPAIDLDVLGG